MSLTSSQIEKYLKRIGFDGEFTELRPDEETLKALHVAHVMTVPYENLDLYEANFLPTDAQTVYRNVVENHRGGLCLDLNTLFGSLLESLGYGVEYGEVIICFIPEDGLRWHHVLRVRDCHDKLWFCDIAGFASNARLPILFESGLVQEDFGEIFRMLDQKTYTELYGRAKDSDDNTWFLQQRTNDTWTDKYMFLGWKVDSTVTTRAKLDDYRTYYDADISKNRYFELKTPEGRITLHDNILRGVFDGSFVKRVVPESEMASVYSLFGLERMYVPEAVRRKNLDEIWIARYLERIGMSPEDIECGPTAELLNRLCIQHNLNVPFENTDFLNRDYRPLSIDLVYHKVVDQKRGGICLEINTLFGELLRKIGYEVHDIKTSRLYPPPSPNDGWHKILIVKSEASSWYVDVGGITSSLKTILKLEPSVQTSDDCVYKFTCDSDGNWTFWRNYGGAGEDNLKATYLFRDSCVSFEETCSHRNAALEVQDNFLFSAPVFSLRTASGLRTFLNGKYRESANGKIEELEVSEDNIAWVYSRFGLSYPPAVYKDRVIGKRGL